MINASGTGTSFDGTAVPLVTAFAPHNAAFANLTQAEMQLLHTRAGCLQHAAFGDIVTTALKKSQVIETMSGGTLIVTRDMATNSVHVNSATVISADHTAHNGVVDIIDQLVDCGVNVNTKNDRDLGAFQNAHHCSTSARNALEAYVWC